MSPTKRPAGEVAPTGRTITPPPSATISEKRSAEQRQDAEAGLSVCRPYAPESERVLFGGVLHGWPDHLDAVRELVEDDLGDPRHLRLLPVLHGLIEQEMVPTPTVVLQELHRTGSVSYRDGSAAPALHGMYAAAHWAGLARYELLGILRASWRRRIVDAGLRLVQYGPDATDESLAELVDREFAGVRAAWERLLRVEAGR